MPEQNSDINSTLNRLKSILVRRRWWILVTMCVVSVAAITASYLLPNHYRSQAIILVANRSVSTQYVVPNDTMNTMEALDAISRGILSQANLLAIVDEFGLYPNLRGAGNDALCARMRSTVEVGPLTKNADRRPMNIFLVAFTANDPSTAQKVTNRLASLFIEQNQQQQQKVDAGTTNFLEQQLSGAQADLDKQQAALESFKRQNLGVLPEQQADNSQALTGLQIQLQSAQADLTRAREQHTYLMAMLSQYAPTGRNGEASAAPGSLTAAREELARLRRERDELLARYNPMYPDVVVLNHQIADKEAEIKEAPAASRPAAAHDAGASVYSSDPAAIQLRSQLQANEMEMQDAQKQAGQLGAEIASYRQRMTVAPVRAQELEDLQRNYDLSKQHYADLLNKKTQSELATDLAAQQRNEQFQIIDPASLPAKPSGPNRQKIALAGLVAGLCAGLALAFLMDSRDRSFHVEKDAIGYFPVPLVIGIPPLLTAGEKRKIARKRRLEWAIACLMLALVVAAQIYVYRVG